MLNYKWVRYFGSLSLFVIVALGITLGIIGDPPDGVGIPPPSPSPTTHNIKFTNNCDETIWVGAIGGDTGTSCTSMNNACNSVTQFCNTKIDLCEFIDPNGGGWEMAQNSTTNITVPIGWNGRFWPRTGCTFNSSGVCDPNTNCCNTGGCLGSDNKTWSLQCAFSGVPPVPISEFTFDAPSGNGPYDTYDISFVDGFNQPLSINPSQGTFNPTPDPGINPDVWCETAGCAGTPTCPSSLVWTDGESCQSPCQFASNPANNVPEDEQNFLCCVCSVTQNITCGSSNCDGGFGCSPNDCSNPITQICTAFGENACGTPRPTPTSWPTVDQDYVTNIHAVCPNVYAWQFDDIAGTFNCRKTNGLVNYEITFCPTPVPTPTPTM